MDDGTWHNLPLSGMNGVERVSGAAFKQLALRQGLERVRSRLKESSDGDRQMVKILTAITVDGLDAVESAAAEALAGGVASADVVLNILARSRPAPEEPSIARSEEHTSELQSPMRISYAVICLKKKQQTDGETIHT